MATPIARIASVDGRMITVVRHPLHVGLHDHPNPTAHAGWTFNADQARELAEAMVRGADDVEGR